jgi:type III restriction enzyme
MDLSATPFFLSGSGYAEGTLFPWTMSDFSLMDAIECGIVKLPRVPVAENIPGTGNADVPQPLGKPQGRQPRLRGGHRAGELDPLNLPTRFCKPRCKPSTVTTKRPSIWDEQWHQGSALFHHRLPEHRDLQAGLRLTSPASSAAQRRRQTPPPFENGALPLFRNYDEAPAILCRARTRSSSTASSSKPAMRSTSFRGMAADEIERFRREIVERAGDARAGDTITDQELLREVMNTVGKHGQLGGSIRCVVSVSMLTEGWDANTVTHVLGIRAFGTQLLCEQVIGRALRRQSYDLNEEGLFNVEYADVFGIPFDFTAKPVIAPPQPPRETVQVKAMRPERDALEIRFPRVEGYRVELPEERLAADFNAESILTLSPDLVGPSITVNCRLIGKPKISTWNTWAMCALHRAVQSDQALALHQMARPRRGAEAPPLRPAQTITKQWLDTCLVCKGGTYPALLMYQALADMACNKITAAITRKFLGERPIKALLDAYNPTGSTMHVRFNTSKADRWETSSRSATSTGSCSTATGKGEFCRVAEAHPKVRAYVKNHGLGLEVPYRYGSEMRKYLPDFIVLVDDGHGDDDLLHLVVEIKGYRARTRSRKKSTMDTYWVPGVNHHGTYGRWAFAEFTEVYQIESDFQGQGRRRVQQDDRVRRSASGDREKVIMAKKPPT